MRTFLVSLYAICLLLGVNVIFAQTNPTGNFSCSVTDPSNAAIPHASVQLTEASNGTTFKTISGSDGHCFVANVPPGTYTATITAQGFQAGSFKSVQIAVGQTYDLKAPLQVGQVSSTVTVDAGQQLVETTDSSISTSVSGPIITHLPSASNSALWGVGMMSPDIQTIGGPRQSSADGLPGGVVNITYDGISAQWQPGKSGDPLFTMVYTNADAVAEFSMSSAAASASETGEGAIQIKMVSPRGSNQFHGGVWEYFRNDDLNSNYYFNNLAGLPRQQVRYNQFGYKIGGPIIKDKLFFYTDLDYWSRPQGVSRTRTILTPGAAGGVYTYIPTAMPASTPSWVTCNASAGTCSANLFQMAAAFGATSKVDPVVGQALAAIQSSTTAPGVHAAAPPSLFQQAITFNNSGEYTQQMPDVRLDWNASSKHSAEFDYHLTRFILNPDILNGNDATYLAAPFNTNLGGYYADRQIFAWAWRWNISPTASNEVRFGFQNSPESFSPNLNLNAYPVANTNLGSINIQPALPSGVSLFDNPWQQVSPTRDNPGVAQLNDNLAWTHGKHNMAFGVTASRQRYKDANYAPEFATVTLGMNSVDPMAANFNPTNLPGISAADQNIAAQLYGVLAGRVTGYNGSVAFDPNTRKFVTGLHQSDRYHQTDLGIYATDSFRLRSNLTLNYGLRWQYEGSPVDDLNEYFNLQGGYAGLFGVSGQGNLFQPGVMTGSSPGYVLDNGTPWYKNWYKGFAPSFGLAWQPSVGGSFLEKVFGKPGATVVRAGYSLAYSREGTQNWVAPSNPGNMGQQYAAPVAPGTALAPGQFAAGSLQLGSLNFPSLAQNPSSFSSSFPVNATAGNAVYATDPNLRMPYVQSWSIGVQRSITKDMALEVRYVGNHGVGLWGLTNLNEVNIFENGFLSEFKNAMSNLNICQANATACMASQSSSGVPASAATAATFADWGLPGQTTLPIFTGAFTGSTNAAARSASQSNANFSSGSFVTPLQSGQAGSVASTLSGQGGQSLSYWQNLMAAGYARNFWVANPDATGSAFVLRNAFQSTYNAMVIGFRRRPAKGLTFDATYTFSKGLTDDWQRNGNNAPDDFETLRNTSLMKGPSPYDLRGALKIYTLYELPFGEGRRWAASNRMLNRVVGGWQFITQNRWQTGRPALLVGGLGGTVNQNDGGVQLNGITMKQLQSEVGVYKTASPAPGAVWYIPQQLLGEQGQGVNTATISPCTTPGQFCGRDFLYGPHFFRSDWSIVKITNITEKVKFEIRAEFLNAFNNANFLWGDAYGVPGYSAGASFFSTVTGNLQNPSFGRIFTAYQDLDSTADPGGRTVQLVARISF
jgi:Carboxypeptidase regulatory-like domain